MDLWVTRGAAPAAAAPRPGLRRGRRRRAVGEDVDHVAAGRRGGRSTRRCRPVDAVVALGIDSPARGVQIVGEHRWGGHADLVVVPGRNVVPKPAGRSWEECAAYPLATLTAWRMLRRARLTAGESVLIVGIGGGVSAAALALARADGRGRLRHVPRRGQAPAGGGAGRGGRLRLRGRLAGEGRRGGRERRAGHLGPLGRGAAARRPARRVRRHVGPQGRADLPALFFKQIEIIGSTMGSYPEFDDVTRLVDQGLPVQVDEVFDRRRLPGRRRAPPPRRPAGQDRPAPRVTAMRRVR